MKNFKNNPLYPNLVLEVNYEMIKKRFHV